MKLIGSHASPFARKARIVLAEKRIDYEFVTTDVHAADTPVSAYNPRGKILVLITEYLDLRFPERDWRAQHANLARHAEKLFKRPAFPTTVPA